MTFRRLHLLPGLLALLLLATAAAAAPDSPPVGPFAGQAYRPTTFGVAQYLDGMVLDIQVGEVTLRGGVLDCQGNIPYRIAGYPVVPALVRELVIPEDACIREVRVVNANWTVLDYQPPIHRVVAKTPEGLKPMPTPQVRLSGPFPASPVRVSESRPLWEYAYRLCYLTVYPAQYDPRTRQTTLYSRLQVQISFGPAGRPQRPDPPFIARAEARYGHLPPGLWERGRRRADTQGADSLLVPASLAPMASALAVDWSDNQPHFRYHLGVWDDRPELKAAESDSDNPPVAYDQARQVVAEAGGKRPQHLREQAAMRAFVAADWEQAPGVVLASPELAPSMCALAGYLNWPLYITAGDGDEPALPPPGPRGRTVISAGRGRGHIRVDSEEDANALLYVVQRDTGFAKVQDSPEYELVTKGVLNPQPAPIPTDAKAVNYLLLYCPTEISQAAVTQLSTYRAATMVNVSTYSPAKRIRDLVVSSYAPTYLALVGDGDHHNVDQFFVGEALADPFDPDYIPTDFLYSVRHGVTYADGNLDGRVEAGDISWPLTTGGTYAWTPDSITGRVMAHDDASFQSYVQTLAAYENLSPDLHWDQLRRAAFFSYFCDDGYIATWDVHGKYTSYPAAALTAHPLYHRPTLEGTSTPDSCYREGVFTRTTTFAEFATGANIYYFNTHGSPNLMVISYLDGESPYYYYEVASHPFTLHPGFVWLDTCLTCAMADAPSSSYHQSPELDDDTCFGAQFLGVGAVGVFGCTMISYGGYIDAVDRALADEMIQQGLNRSLAGDVAYALARYYNAVGGGDAAAQKTILECQFLGDPKVALEWEGLHLAAPTVLINGGAEAVGDTLVTVAVGFPPGATEMRVRNNPGEWGAWQPVASSFSWTLSSGEGTKQVCVQCRNASGTTSFQGYDTILLDLTGPAAPVVSINGGASYTSSTAVTLTVGLPAGADAMRIRNEGEAWTDWQACASSIPWTLTPGDGLKRVYVQCRDSLGNPGQEGSDDITLDTGPPTGLQLRINGGAACTTYTAVTLTLSASADAAEMQFRNLPDGTYTAWEPFAPSRAWTLPTGPGTKTVGFRCRDSLGNTAQEVTASIRLTSFADVACSSSQLPYIEALVREGISSGCSPGPPALYCPDASITRGQMAVFLCRAAGLAPYAKPVPTFADVPAGHSQYGYIEAVYQAGITSGCATSPLRYCPDQPVTRGQMAVFLCRAASLAPYAKPVPTFADVPTTSSQYPYVERMYANGITGGCATAPLRYCPASPVTRGQMAVFICRAFSIPLE